MKLPDGLTEAEFLASLERVVRVLAPKFRFGSYELADLKQEAAIFAIKAVSFGGYDASRPLDNFLYIHIRNRFINFKRDNYSRKEVPCKGCVFHDKVRSACMAFEAKPQCEAFASWSKTNTARQNILKPIGITEVGEAHTQYDDMDQKIDQMDYRELDSRIDKELPAELRSDYLRMRAGGPGTSVPKVRRDKVKEAVLSILQCPKDGGEATRGRDRV